MGLIDSFSQARSTIMAGAAAPEGVVGGMTHGPSATSASMPAVCSGTCGEESYYREHGRRAD